ncbi:MAG: sigma-54-dependent Fis family transcriptional regulator, partial [Bdellovibrio sp. CG10_big_fil_rev_8_21_14_0_10_47_8]
MSLSSQYHLLVVDDDSLLIDSLKLILPKYWRLTSVQNAKDLNAKVMFHAAFVDMHLTKGSTVAEGPDVIAQLAKWNPQLEIVAMSGDLSVDLMEKCLKNGAQKFLAKPLMRDEVIATLEKIEALWMMRQLEGMATHQQVRWVGSSPASEGIKKSIAHLRGEMNPVLIEGETGTGKEVAFRLLNQQEGSRPFVAVNMASIPENLFESEMFGHVRGAFTGAETQKIGLTEAAHGGDLFLDEIEALPLAQQGKLLRFLETGEVRKVGAKEPLHVQVRVICASNQNLSELVRSGKFREDLLFRISGQKLQLPPLRERSTDIDELAAFFLQLQKPRINKTFSADGLQALKSYPWPGNVRELKRICEQVALTSPLPIIRAQDVERLLNQQDSPEIGAIDLRKGLAGLTEEFEASVIKKCLGQEP